jgi:hypothetical protein
VGVLQTASEVSTGDTLRPDTQKKEKKINGDGGDHETVRLNLVPMCVLLTPSKEML